MPKPRGKGATPVKVREEGEGGVEATNALVGVDGVRVERDREGCSGGGCRRTHGSE